MPLNDVDEDGNGHGTHCAGTIASRRYGVAKKANLIAVKVLGSNGSGSMSDVVGGVVWAATEAAKAAAKARAEFAATGYTAHKGSVANMSLGGGKSKALDDAVNAAVDNGMHFAVAAGNDNKDACNYSPAAAQKAVTVGASTIGDERAYFSNWGTCVDVFAPGLSILSTWTGSKTATNTISGTSMASPHTAGMLAYLLSLYPSKSFDPSTQIFDFETATDFFSMASATTNEYPIAGLSTILKAFKSVMPSWIGGNVHHASRSFVDTYQGGYEVAAVPDTISPKHMKQALLALATSGKLTDLPGGSPNLLIYNNATALA
jgi:cerevisin